MQTRSALLRLALPEQGEGEVKLRKSLMILSNLNHDRLHSISPIAL